MNHPFHAYVDLVFLRSSTRTDLRLSTSVVLTLTLIRLFHPATNRNFGAQNLPCKGPESNVLFPVLSMTLLLATSIVDCIYCVFSGVEAG